jgi:protein-tyrosine phosphatase
VIDLHSHLLPGVDDGARTVAQSVVTLQALAEGGVTDICLTPHFTASALEGGVPDAHEEAWAALRREMPVGPQLYRGAEVMLDRGLGPKGAANPAFRLNCTRYMLVEFPRMVSADAVFNALRGVVETGVTPLLAHPERYTVCQPALVARWRALGALMQVDATTALMATRRGDRARALLAHGFADIVAADNHGDNRTMADIRRALEAQGDGEAAALLTTANPRAILENRPTLPVPPVQVKLPLKDRIRRIFGGDD